jgi:hypothetical protein
VPAESIVATGWAAVSATREFVFVVIRAGLEVSVFGTVAWLSMSSSISTSLLQDLGTVSISVSWLSVSASHLASSSLLD